MMFDPLSIDRRHFGTNSKCQEKLVDDLVPPLGLMSQSLSRVGQLQGAVRLARDEPFAFQSSDDLGDGHMTDFELPSQVHDAAFSLLTENGCNGLHVVFRRFGGMIAASPMMAVGRLISLHSRIESYVAGVRLDPIDTHFSHGYNCTQHVATATSNPNRPRKGQL